VADVAKAAGVAAGTVYLYFRSKDDLLVSIFEQTMREGLDQGRDVAAGVRDPRERLLRLARLHLARLGRDRNLAIVFQVELRQSIKFMERFSATLLRDYLTLIRAAIADGQAAGVFRADLNPTSAAKMIFGALDEMATNWMLSRRRYSLEDEADAVVDLFVNGARPK
jgi:TetR/AcrR family fatty acid metabolism transcriptional regulator